MDLIKTDVVVHHKATKKDWTLYYAITLFQTGNRKILKYSPEIHFFLKFGDQLGQPSGATLPLKMPKDKNKFFDHLAQLLTTRLLAQTVEPYLASLNAFSASSIGGTLCDFGDELIPEVEKILRKEIK